MAPKLTEAERQRIAALLADGKSQGAVSRELGRSRAVVNKIARESGVTNTVTNVRDTKKATEARSAYAEERRLELIGRGFDKADELLAKITDAGELQKWTVALGTMVDKARLETGEATNRSESKHQHRTLDLSQATAEELDEFERIVGGS